MTPFGPVHVERIMSHEPGTAAPIFGSPGHQLYRQRGLRLTSADGVPYQMVWTPPGAMARQLALPPSSAW